MFCRFRTHSLQGWAQIPRLPWSHSLPASSISWWAFNRHSSQHRTSLSYPKYLHPAFKLFCTISWYQAPQTVGPQHWPLPVTLWGIPYSSSELEYLKNLGIWTLEALQQLATLGLYLKWQQLIRTEWQPSSVTRDALFSLLKITHHSLSA